MLTITPNQTATELVVYHPLLATTLQSLEMELGIGCTTLSPIAVSWKIPLITNNSFTLSLVDVYPTNTPSKFPDGIYKAELTFEVDAAVQLNIPTVCFFIDYDLKCTIDTTDKVKMQKYKALLYGNDCDSCDCASMCQIFDSLISTTTTTNDTNCGCN